MVDNQQVKPLLVKFNRWLANAVGRMNVLFDRVKFLPVHVKFLDEHGPMVELFNDDQLTLNAARARLLKITIFEMAGFVRNDK